MFCLYMMRQIKCVYCTCVLRGGGRGEMEKISAELEEDRLAVRASQSSRDVQNVIESALYIVNYLKLEDEFNRVCICQHGNHVYYHVNMGCITMSTEYVLPCQQSMYCNVNRVCIAM